jgi:methyl coenzyme M reductase beta subunit
MSFGAAVVAIGSAGLANFVVTQHSAGMAVPTIVAAVVVSAAALGISLLWEENTVSSHGKFLGTVRATFRIFYGKVPWNLIKGNHVIRLL